MQFLLRPPNIPQLHSHPRINHTSMIANRQFVHPTNLVEVSPVVVLTTSQTTTTRMFPVLSYTTVTGRNVPSVLAGV